MLARNRLLSHSLMSHSSKPEVTAAEPAETNKVWNITLFTAQIWPTVKIGGRQR
jgi:hypothetical protein